MKPYIVWAIAVFLLVSTNCEQIEGINDDNKDYGLTTTTLSCTTEQTLFDVVNAIIII